MKSLTEDGSPDGFRIFLGWGSAKTSKLFVIVYSVQGHIYLMQALCELVLPIAPSEGRLRGLLGYEE